MLIWPRHLVTTEDLFENFDMTELTGKGNLKRTYKCADKKTLAKKIFLRFFQIMIDDMLKGGVQFVFPERQYFALQFKRLVGDQFKKVRKAGGFKDVDFLTSSFTGYMLNATYLKGTRQIYDTVRLSDGLTQKITEKTNEGYKYC